MRYIALLVLILITGTAAAQYNDTTMHMVSFAATGTINKTNNDRVSLFNNTLKYGIRKKTVSLNSNTNWVYGKTKSTLTNNDFRSALDLNLYSTLPHFYYWGLGNYTTSYSLKINNQAQAGAGIAYNIYDRPEATLNISDGILYEHSDLLVNDTVRDRYSTLRNSFRLSFKFVVFKSIVLSSASFYQNSLQNGSDYIIRSDNSVAIKVRKWLSFTSALSYNRLNRTGKETLLFSYGLLIEKYY